MLGVNLENTTSDQFQLSLAGRYLRFDVLGSGSELRLDAIVGADPGLVAALYRPIWRALFVVPYAGIGNRTFNLISDDAIVARYGQTVSHVGADVGVNLGRDSDLRLGATIGRLDASVKIGDPGLPSVAGKETRGRPDVAPRHAGQRRRFPRAAPARRPRSATSSTARTSPWTMRRFDDHAQQRRLAAAGGRSQLVLADRRAQPPVRARRRRHVVRPPAAAGRSVCARQAAAPRRLQRGRDPRRSLRDRHGRLSSRAGPDAGLPRRPDLRRRLARERRCLRPTGTTRRCGPT